MRASTPRHRAGSQPLRLRLLQRRLRPQARARLMGLSIRTALLLMQQRKRYVFMHAHTSSICPSDGCGVLSRYAGTRNATGYCLPTTAAASARGAGSA